MAGSLTVRQARLVLPDRVVVGDLVVEDGIITEIAPRVDRPRGVQVDGQGCALLPGLVDSHVHLDACEDLATVSSGAVAGGVTSVLGVRSARTRAELKLELAQAQELARVHYGLYLRATADNLEEIAAAERARGIWVSGELLGSDDVDDVFAATDRIVVVDNVLPERLAERAQLYPDVHDPHEHPRLHDVDSAVAATRRALELARIHGVTTHLLHISTAEEVALLAEDGRPESVTAAARAAHLFLGHDVYSRLGTRAVASPPVRGERHRTALWRGLSAPSEHALGGAIDLISSGHLPVRAETKDRPYPTTHPGMPAIEWLLPLLLDRVVAGHLTLADIARLTSEAPATTFGLPRKGRLETGYDGDLVLVDLELTRTVGRDAPIQTSCGWSPWEGIPLNGWPVLTVLLGEVVFREGEHLLEPRGRGL